MSLVLRKYFLAKLFLKVFANDEYDFAESGFDGIVNRIIHDGFTVGT